MKTQYGFRKNRSIADGLFVAKRMMEYAGRPGGKELMLLLDRENTFDKISHEWLFKVLEFFDIPEEILGIIRGLYKNPEFFV